MKHKTRVIQISGFRGLVMAIFVVTCLAAGFIAFPSIVAMHAWNWLANYIALPVINVMQGAMLWAIVAICGFIINDRKKYLVAFSPKTQLSEDEMRKIMERVKKHSQNINSMMIKDIKSLDEIKELSEEEKENV